MTLELRPEHVPTADEVCLWLAGGPSYDEVVHAAKVLRHMLNDVGPALGLMRQHVLHGMGEPLTWTDEEPF